MTLSNNNSNAGELGGGHGPADGGTGGDADPYADLHSNGNNPYAQGSPAVDLADDTGSHFAPFGSGTPGAYYLNSPAAAGNPYSGGSAGQYDPGNAYVSSGMDNAYGNILGYQGEAYGDAGDPNSGNPNQQGIRQDTGQDDSLLPPDQRR